jgi:hypothetical protein
LIDSPVFCLEDEIAAHRANVLIIDIEGGEIALLRDADLSAIRLIIIEQYDRTKGAEATAAMIGDLVAQGFMVVKNLSKDSAVVLRRKLGFNQNWVQPWLNHWRLMLRRMFNP